MNTGTDRTEEVRHDTSIGETFSWPPEERISIGAALGVQGQSEDVQYAPGVRQRVSEIPECSGTRRVSIIKWRKEQAESRSCIKCGDHKQDNCKFVPRRALKGARSRRSTHCEVNEKARCSYRICRQFRLACYYTCAYSFYSSALLPEGQVCSTSSSESGQN